MDTTTFHLSIAELVSLGATVDQHYTIEGLQCRLRASQVDVTQIARYAAWMSAGHIPSADARLHAPAVAVGWSQACPGGAARRLDVPPRGVRRPEDDSPTMREVVTPAVTQLAGASPTAGGVTSTSPATEGAATITASGSITTAGTTLTGFTLSAETTLTPAGIISTSDSLGARTLDELVAMILDVLWSRANTTQQLRAINDCA
ncbi:MAG: hypothetical protein ACLP52_01785 [Streptosporangiaceae bacterium]